MGGTRGKPNFSMVAEGESKIKIDIRIANELLAEIHKQLSIEKGIAKDTDWTDPKLTNVVEMLLRKGLRARKAELSGQKHPPTP